MSGLSWTEEELSSLDEMLHSGLSFAEIAKRTGRTLNSVTNKVTRVRRDGKLCESWRKPQASWREEEDAKLLRALRTTKMGYKGIAKLVGRTYESVQARVLRLKKRGIDVGRPSTAKARPDKAPPEQKPWQTGRNGVYAKPKKAKNDDIKYRECISCRTMFLSSGWEHRRCRKCRRDPDYKAGIVEKSLSIGMR